MKGVLCKILAINLDDELKTYRRKIDCLTAVESDNLTVLKNAEIQPGKRQKSEVELWFANVKEKKSEHQRIETEFREKGPSRNLKSRIEKETKEVEELTQQGKFPTGVVLDDHESTRIPMVATTLVGQSFTENVDSILKLLKEDSVFAIGVYGMGGVGKTTLMKYIHNRLQKDSGTAVYWVTVSQDCSLEKLQNEIGKVVRLDLSEEDKERKKALLFHRLSGVGKSVIILDDLWKHYLLEQVGVPLDSSGCKIVMTTRLKEVCCRMSCQKIIKIEPLCKNDAWKLFAKHLEEIPSHLTKLAEEIVRECGGLPLALITMGCCARAYDTIHDWENALYELRRPVSRQEVMEEEVFRVLKFSFDSLKDRKVQNCFLCCALFPEDRRIYKEYLVDLWIDAGLLDEVPSPQDKVSRGHAILNRLLSSCLLESGELTYFEDSVQMHDLVRDMAIIITQNDPRFLAKSGDQQEEVPEEEQWSKGLVKVSLSHNKIMEIPNGMAPLTPELTVLMLNNNPLTRIPESFFMNMRALTVLDLSYTSIVRLPESVSDLENLRALLLAECYELTYVPSLAKLSNLRVLDLDYAYKLEKAPDGIEKLKCLEKVTYLPWDVSDSTGFNKLIQSLPSSISCYKFRLHDPKLFNSYEFNIFRREFENDVWVRGAKIEDDETTYMLPATIEMLEIYKCDVNRRNLGDVFPTLGFATDLKKMYIRYCNGLKYISSASSSSSSSGPQQGSFAENIYLYDLPDLRGIIEFGRCSFSHLCYLEIEKCPKIKVIFPLPEKQLSLPNLKYLRVSNCAELEELFESNNGNHTNSAVALPNLVTVYLYSLPKLRRVYMNLHLCTSLEELGVIFCDELEEIFDGGGSNGSSSSTLQGGTETLVVDPMNACYPQPNPISVLPKLKIIHLDGLPKLGSIYKDLCPSLEKLDVWDCKELEEIFGSGGSNSSSPSSQGETETLVVNPISGPFKLKIIRLMRLPKLESICKDLHLCTSLEELEVEFCPKIERIFEAPQPILTLPNLRKLKLLRLQYLSSIHKGLLLCISLKEFYVEGCLKLKKVPLSDHLICDDSPSSLLSLPSESHNPELWELLQSKYSEDARLLSDYIQDHVKLEEHNQNHLKLKRKRSDLEG